MQLASSSWGDEEREAAIRVINSGKITMGEYVGEFERKFAEYIGTTYAVMVNSGSSANLLMVAAYTLINGKGTVVVPALAWSTSYSPFQQYGWKLTFCDIDRETLNFDHELLWKSACGKARDLSEDADLILAVNILGNPCDFNGFPSKVPMIEDNCESLGATYKYRKTGSWGVMGTHSLFFSHHICVGEGGVITTNSAEYYEMLLALRAHGWTRDLPINNGFHEKPGGWRFVVPGYNVRPTEIAGAIGLEQLKRLPGLVAQRRENALRFPLAKQKEIGESSWYGFAIMSDDRDKLIRQLNERGIEHRPVVAGNFLRHPASHYFDYISGPLPNVDYIHDHGVMIGNHGSHIDWDILDGIEL